MPTINYERWLKDKPILTRERADERVRGGCQQPGCTHAHEEQPLHLHARCHLTAPPEIVYYKGSLFVSCPICQQFIARFLVAGNPDLVAGPVPS